MLLGWLKGSLREQSPMQSIFFENNDPVVEEEKNKMLKSFQDSPLNGIRRASNTVLAENQKVEKENKLLNARISVLEKTQEASI